MASREKERLVNVLESLERRLTVIDDAQAEMIGGVENLRSTMHEINNSLTVIKVMMPDFERALEADAREIRSILSKLDGIAKDIGALNTKIVSREDVVRSLLRTGDKNG